MYGERTLAFSQGSNFKPIDTGLHPILANNYFNSMNPVFIDKVIKKLEDDLTHTLEQKSYSDSQSKASIEKNGIDHQSYA